MGTNLRGSLEGHPHSWQQYKPPYRSVLHGMRCMRRLAQCSERMLEGGRWRPTPCIGAQRQRVLRMLGQRFEQLDGLHKSLEMTPMLCTRRWLLRYLPLDQEMRP